MSFVTDVLTAAFRPKRKIGSFTAQVTIEEQHTDELTITQHPVEQGAAITDHAFKNPAQVVIRIGQASSLVQGIASAVSGFASGGVAGLLGASEVKDTYAKLLKLQADREPMDVVTGKRTYKNMLIRSLATTTDEKTEHVLIITVTLQEVIIVETQATTTAPASAQAQPEKTAPVQAAGSKQLNPAPAANQDSLKVLADLKALKAQAGG